MSTRYKSEASETANARVYKKAHLAVVCRKTKKCPYCPPHGGENTKMNGGKIGRNWKKKRKTKHRKLGS